MCLHFWHLADGSSDLQLRHAISVGWSENGAVQVSMNQMMATVSSFDNGKLPIRHIPGPEGVRGRNSDNARILERLGWEPTVKLEDGLRITYGWIKKQLLKVLPCPCPSCRLLLSQRGCS